MISREKWVKNRANLAQFHEIYKVDGYLLNDPGAGQKIMQEKF